MIVFLCRHGDAVDGNALPNDESRFLTLEGRAGVTEVGRALLQRGDTPDLILTSPLVRAVQTAELLAPQVRYDGAVEVLPPLAPGGQLGEVLAELMLYEPRLRVFLVGHEPQMSAWTAQLLGRPSLGRAFEKGGVARLSWDGHAERGHVTSALYLSPRQLAAAPL